MSVRASPVSKTAAVLIIAIGIFVLLTGLVADDLINDVAGIAFIILGLALYGLLLRFTRGLENQLRGNAR